MGGVRLTRSEGDMRLAQLLFRLESEASPEAISTREE